MYEWHVFVSYPRAGKIPGWVMRVFVPQLTAELGALGIRDPRVFVDAAALTTGDWPAHLRRAHQASRVFVPVLSAPYFTSGWCVAEWRHAFERERIAWGETHTGELVVPILFNDCNDAHLDALPSPLREQVKARVRPSFKDYTSLIDPEENVPAAFAFRRAMATLCEDRIVPAITRCPDYRDDWPVLPVQPVSGADPTWFPELAR